MSPLFLLKSGIARIAAVSAPKSGSHIPAGEKMQPADIFHDEYEAMRINASGNNWLFGHLSRCDAITCICIMYSGGILFPWLVFCMLARVQIKHGLTNSLADDAAGKNWPLYCYDGEFRRAGRCQLIRRHCYYGSFTGDTILTYEGWNRWTNSMVRFYRINLAHASFDGTESVDYVCAQTTDSKSITAVIGVSTFQI